MRFEPRYNSQVCKGWNIIHLAIGLSLAQFSAVCSYFWKIYKRPKLKSKNTSFLLNYSPRTSISELKPEKYHPKNRQNRALKKKKTQVKITSNYQWKSNGGRCNYYYILWRNPERKTEAEKESAKTQLIEVFSRNLDTKN